MSKGPEGPIASKEKKPRNKSRGNGSNTRKGGSGPDAPRTRTPEPTPTGNGSMSQEEIDALLGSVVPPPEGTSSPGNIDPAHGKPEAVTSEQTLSGDGRMTETAHADLVDQVRGLGIEVTSPSGRGPAHGKPDVVTSDLTTERVTGDTEEAPPTLEIPAFEQKEVGGKDTESLPATDISLEGFPLNLIAALEACGYVVQQDETARQEMISIKTPDNEVIYVTEQEAIDLVRGSVEHKYRIEEKPEVSDSSAEESDPWSENFGLSEGELSGIEGYELLREPQRRLLFENFNQIVLGKIEEDVALLVRSAESQDKKRYERLGAFMGRVVGSLHSAVTKTYREVTQGKEQAKKEKLTGLDPRRRALLTDLVQTMLRFGPKVHEENGELQVSFVNLLERGKQDTEANRKKTRDEIRNEERSIEAQLNKTAHAFAKVPLSWRNDSPGAQERNEYKFVTFLRRTVLKDTSLEQSDTFTKTKEAYTEAKAAYEKLLTEKGLSEAEIAQELISVDARVHQLQLIQTNPEAVEGLASIADRGFLREVGEQFVRGPGVYMALGFAGRTMLSFAGSVFVAPLASAGVGYLRSWNRSGAELRERDRDAVRGIQDTKEGALNVVSSSNLKKRLEQSIQRVKDSSGTDRTIALASLRKRIAYTQDKQMLNRVNYGTRDGVITQNLELSSALSEALAFTYAQDDVFSEEVLSRLDDVDIELKRYLGEKGERTEKSRIAFRKLTSTKGAMTAYGFGLVGSYLGMQMRERFIEGGAAVVGQESLPETPPPVSARGVVETQSPVNTLNAETPNPGAAVREGAPPVESVPVDPNPSSNSALETPPLIPEPEAPSAAPANGGSEVYTVKRGDNLTNILSREMRFDGVSEEAKSRYAYRFIRTLTSEELKSVGVRSENPDLIYPDDTIDLKKIEEILKTKDLSKDLQPSRIREAPTRAPVENQSSGPRSPGTDPVPTSRSQMATEALGKSATPESNIRGVSVETARAELDAIRPRMTKEFLEGKIDLKVWETIRGKDAVSLPQQIDSIYGNTFTPEQRRLGILRKMFELYEVKPRMGETHEAFIKRGMEAMDRDILGGVKNTDAFKMWMSRYESFRPGYNYADQNNIIRDNRAYVDAYQKWSVNETQGIRGAKPYPPPFFDEKNYLKSVNPPLAAVNTGAVREWRFETPTDPSVSSGNSNTGAVKEAVFKALTDDRLEGPRVNQNLNGQNGINRPSTGSLNQPLAEVNTGAVKEAVFSSPTDNRGFQRGGRYLDGNRYQRIRPGEDGSWFNPYRGLDVAFYPHEYGRPPASENIPFEAGWRPFKDYDFKAF